MIRKDIVQLFYQHLRREESGRFIIELEDDRSYIDVEDAPYAVRSITRTFGPDGGGASFLLLLNDETIETLEPASLRIGRDNVLYCTVREGRFEAKFSRAAYYQIANSIEYDSARDQFYIVQEGSRFALSPKE